MPVPLMIDEQLEFQIAQYADGTLPESERALVELRLLSDADARALLDEYRSLDSSLKASMPLPLLDWEGLANRLSEAVDREREREHSAATVLGRIGFAGRLAIAACVVLAVGGVALWTAMKSGPEDNRQVVSTNTSGSEPDHEAGSTNSAETRVLVRGPSPEAAGAPPVVIVSVGPSSQVTPDWRAAEGVVTGPSRAIWIASTYDGAQDTQRLPY